MEHLHDFQYHLCEKSWQKEPSTQLSYYEYKVLFLNLSSSNLLRYLVCVSNLSDNYLNYNSSYLYSCYQCSVSELGHGGYYEILSQNPENV